MRPRLLVLLGLLWLGTPADAACTLARIADLPITMAGLRPMVDATINGHAVRFLADSGAFFSLITPGTAAELGLKLQAAPAGFSLEGVGGRADASVVTVRDFSVSGHSIPREQFLVGGSEVGSAGLLGENLLGLRDAEYDLAGGIIRLMEARDCGRTNLAYWAKDKPVAEIEIGPLQSDRHISGTVSVNGVRLRAIFDTGAATSAMTVQAAARAGVRVTDAGVRAAGYSSGLGRHVVRSWTAPFASFAVGAEEVKNTRLRIADFGDSGFDMLVGADFFLSHHIYVANGLHRMFLTYNGGPVFDLAAGAAALEPDPPAAIAVDAAPPAAKADAGDLARRGAALAARRDFAGALALLDQAVAATPEDAELRLVRGRVHLALRQPLLAAADFDKAVSLRPDDPELRLTRATLRLRANDRVGAREDTDAAARAAAGPADIRLTLGALYDTLDAPAEAIAQYDLWIAAHPDDSRRPSALNGRCYARALADVDLDKALADCDAALRARPRTAAYLDSRGLVFLRKGDLDRAIADYDAALAIEPRLAWSLYGRGIAKARKGQAAEGQADIAAATALASALPARARRYGLAPPG